MQKIYAEIDIVARAKRLGPVLHTALGRLLAHPLVGEVSLADLDQNKLAEAKARHGLERTFKSLEGALAADGTRQSVCRWWKLTTC